MFLYILLEVHPLIKPDLGLSVWTIITFLILLLLLRVLAWKPITTSIKKRESFINQSLEQAVLAKEELSELKAKKDEIIKNTETRRLEILKQAESVRQETIQKAEIEAKKHGEEIKKQYLAELNAQREHVILSIEQEIAKIALNIAEKALKQELNSKSVQEDIINKFAKNITI